MSPSGLSPTQTMFAPSRWKLAKPETPSLGRTILESFSGVVSSLEPAVQKRFQPLLQELKSEKDNDFLLHGLLQVGIRLKSEHQEIPARTILERLTQSDIPEDVRNHAEKEFGAIAGIGSFGMRVEYLGSRLFQDGANWQAIAPMIGATIVGQVAGTLVLGKLAGRVAGPLTRGLGAKLTAGTAAFLAEFPSFAVLSQALSPISGEAFSEILVRSALSLGAMRCLSAFGAYGARWIGTAGTATVPLTHASAFFGLLSAYKLEQHFNLRPPSGNDATMITDVLVSLAGLLTGIHLGNRFLGRSFAVFRKELEVRTDNFTQNGGAMENPPASLLSRIVENPPAIGSAKSFRPDEPKGPTRFAMSGKEKKDEASGGDSANPSSLKKGEKLIRLFDQRTYELICRVKTDPQAVEALAKAAETDNEVLEDLYVYAMNGDKIILEIIGRAVEKNPKASQVLGHLVTSGFEGALDILGEKAVTNPWARGALFGLAYDKEPGTRDRLMDLAERSPEAKRFLQFLRKQEPFEKPHSWLGDFILPPTLKKLSARLRNSPWECRRCSAAIALGRTGVSDTRPVLEEALGQDPSKKVRKSAATALGWLKDDRAIPSLKSALQDLSPEVRMEAAHALTKLGVGNWNILTILRRGGIQSGAKNSLDSSWKVPFFQARVLSLAQAPKDKKYFSGLKKLAQGGSKKADLILFMIDKAQKKVRSGEISTLTPRSFLAEVIAEFPEAKEIERAPTTSPEREFFFPNFSYLPLLKAASSQPSSPPPDPSTSAPAVGPLLLVQSAGKETLHAFERDIYALMNGGAAFRAGEMAMKRRFVQARVKKPIHYYIGIGSPNNTKNTVGNSHTRIGLDIAMPLLETDFETLVGVDLENFTFEGFQEGVRINVAQLYDPTTGKSVEKTLFFRQLGTGRYEAIFTYGGKPRRVVVYSGKDLTQEEFIPEEIEGGYHILNFHGAAFYATEKTAPYLIQLLVPGQGMIFGGNPWTLKEDNFTQDPIRPGHPARNIWHYLKNSGNFSMTLVGEYDLMGSTQIWAAVKDSPK